VVLENAYFTLRIRDLDAGLLEVAPDGEVDVRAQTADTLLRIS
jgi:hypothetical protein